MSEDFAKNKPDRENELDDWSEFDFREIKSQRPHSTQKREIKNPSVRLMIILGALVGAASLFLQSTLSDFLFKSQLCRNISSATLCSSSNNFMFAASLIIVGIVVLFYLAWKHIARATLIILSSCLALASLQPFLSLSVLGIITSAIFGAAFFVFFAKIATFKSYALATLADVILLVSLWLLARS